MTTRYSYEFKTFKSGKRKGQSYCNVRSTKTGKTIKTVSSKANLRTAYQSYSQQKRRAIKKKEWETNRKSVEARGGTRKQYEKAKKRLTEKDKERIKIEKDANSRRKRTLQRQAIEKTGYSTCIHAFYQIGRTPKAQPYIVGESDAEHDVDIEYSSWQQKLDGDNFKYNIEDLRRDFQREIEDAETSELQVFYGGYEITVVDNETGKVIQRESEGGYYPSDKLKQTQSKAKTRRRRSKTRRF